jgi:hypothetical protein
MVMNDPKLGEPLSNYLKDGELKSALFVLGKGVTEIDSGEYLGEINSYAPRMGTLFLRGNDFRCIGEDFSEKYRLVEPEDGRKILFRTDRLSSFGACSVGGMDIDRADANHNYEGTVLCADHIEVCVFENFWQAMPSDTKIQEVFGRKYAFEVRPNKKHSITGGYHFTLLESFNDVIEHYVMHGILELNPELPSLEGKKD